MFDLLRIASATAIVIPLVACGSETPNSGDGKTFPRDTSKEGLEEFLAAGTYKQAPWVFDAAPRASVTTHLPQVRVFFNPTAADAISEGKSDDAPKGSMIVKELYDATGKRVGVAASLLDEEKSSSSAWIHYCNGPADNCALSSATESADGFYATGSNECATCHSGSIYAKLP